MIALQIIALTPPSPIEFAREKFGVRAKHSDRKSRVSVIGYCPNASPLLNHLTIRLNAPHLSLIYLVRYAIEERTLLLNKLKINIAQRNAGVILNDSN
jgi:hypothetical protein